MKIHTFAERLQELKDIKGLKNTDLANAAGVDRSNITRYLNGTYEAKQDFIYDIAKAFCVSEAWLMGYDVSINGDAVPGSDRQELINLINSMPDEQVSAFLKLLKK